MVDRWSSDVEPGGNDRPSVRWKREWASNPLLEDESAAANRRVVFSPSLSPVVHAALPAKTKPWLLRNRAAIEKAREAATTQLIDELDKMFSDDPQGEQTDPASGSGEGVVSPRCGKSESPPSSHRHHNDRKAGKPSSPEVHIESSPTPFEESRTDDKQKTVPTPFPVDCPANQMPSASLDARVTETDRRVDAGDDAVPEGLGGEAGGCSEENVCEAEALHQEYKAPEAPHEEASLHAWLRAAASRVPALVTEYTEMCLCLNQIVLQHSLQKGPSHGEGSVLRDFPLKLGGSDVKVTDEEHELAMRLLKAIATCQTDASFAYRKRFLADGGGFHGDSAANAAEGGAHCIRKRRRLTKAKKNQAGENEAAPEEAACGGKRKRRNTLPQRKKPTVKGPETQWTELDSECTKIEVDAKEGETSPQQGQGSSPRSERRRKRSTKSVGSDPPSDKKFCPGSSGATTADCETNQAGDADDSSSAPRAEDANRQTDTAEEEAGNQGGGPKDAEGNDTTWGREEESTASSAAVSPTCERRFYCAKHGEVEKGGCMPCRLCESEQKEVKALIQLLASRGFTLIGVSKSLGKKTFQIKCNYGHLATYVEVPPSRCMCCVQERFRNRQEEERRSQQMQKDLFQKAKANMANIPQQPSLGKYIENDPTGALAVSRLLRCAELKVSAWTVLDVATPAGVRKREEALDKARASYKRLAMRVHPDKCSHPNSKEAFHILDQAYRTLLKKEALIK